MGKVVALVAGAVLIAIIIAIVVVYYRRRKAKDDALKHGWAQKGDLSSAQEANLKARLDTITAVVQDMLYPGNLRDDMTILSRGHRKTIEEWIKRGSK